MTKIINQKGMSQVLAIVILVIIIIILAGLGYYYFTQTGKEINTNLTQVKTNKNVNQDINNIKIDEEIEGKLKLNITVDDKKISITLLTVKQFATGGYGIVADVNKESQFITINVKGINYPSKDMPVTMAFSPAYFIAEITDPPDYFILKITYKDKEDSYQVTIKDKEITIYPQVSIFTEVVVDTSDWQTYTNKDFGFSLRHPNDWHEVISKDSQTGAAIIEFTSVDESEYVTIHPQGASDRGSSTNTKIETTTLGGKSALRKLVTYPEDIEPDLCYYEFPIAPAKGWTKPSDNKIGNFITTLCKQSETVKTILSTLQFTE